MRKFIFFMFVSVILLQGISVFAENIDDNIMALSNGVIKISGKTSNDNVGKDLMITVLIFGEEPNEQEILNNDTSATAFTDTATVGEDGTYSFDFALTQMNKYTVQIGGFANNTIIQKTLYFTRVSDLAPILTDLNQAGDKIGVKTLLVDNKEVLSLCIHLYNDVNLEDVAGILHDYMQISDLDIIDVNKANIILNKCFIIQALNENKLNSIMPYMEYLTLPDSTLMSLFIEKKAKDITNRLLSKNFTSTSGFDYALKEAIILNKILYADGYGETEETIKVYGADMNIDTASITESMYRSVSGQFYKDYAALKNALDEASVKPSEHSSGASPRISSSASYSPSVSNMTIGAQFENANEAALDTYSFKDIDGVVWAQEAINYLYKNEIIAGKGNGIFAPNDYVTREEFTKMMIKLLNINITLEPIAFSDISEDDWYYEYVNKAYHSGLIKGINDSIFGAGSNISRQDIAVIIYRAVVLAGYELPSTDTVQFADAEDVSEYAVQAVNLLREARIFEGNENNCFKPQGFATRAECAKVLYNVSIMKQ